jgi:excisionase family DNA binding protein
MSILAKRWCWLTTGDTARLLQVTTRGVRWLAATKRLTAERTGSGQWLFRSDDVERAMLHRGRGRLLPRAERLRAVRLHMLKVGIEPRQLALFRRAGERSLPDAEVKGRHMLRESA